MNFRKNILILLLGIFLPFFASAQTENNLILSLSPENPGPEENVTATISTFAFDLERSKVSWSLNGKLTSEGTGKKSFSFKTGKEGTKTVLAVSVTPAGGAKITKSLTIQPIEADVLFQAVNSYTPPFYRGRTLPARESEILALVIPNGVLGGKTLKAEDFIYTWKKNASLAPEGSGFAKNSFTFKNRLIDETENIEVEMSELKNRAQINKSVSISPQKPEIVFYEKDSVRGVNYNQALSGEFRLTKSETTILAAPFFFSLNNGQELKYKWFFNDELVPNQTKSELAIKKPAISGQTKVSVEIEKPQTLFQSAKASLIVRY